MLRTYLALVSIFAHLFNFRGRLGVNDGQGGYSPPSQPPQSSGSSDTSTLAIITLILGISAWTFLPGIGGWGGMITGWIELSNIMKGKSDESNKMITQIGFWASAASVILQVLSGCLVAAAFLIYGAAVFSAIGLSAASQ